MRVILFLIVLSAASSGRTDLVGAVEPGSTPLPAMPAGEDVEGDAPAVTGDGVDSDPKDAPYGNAANGLAVDVVKQLNVSLQEVLENAKQLGYQGHSTPSLPSASLWCTASAASPTWSSR
jgi:hypothetical protein